MIASRTPLFGLAASLVVLTFAGCANDILDPSQTGRFRPVPVVNVILDSLGVADEPDPTYAGAEEPLPEDIIDYERDYTFGPGDLVRISIYELRNEGIPFINDYAVTESGRVSIPDVGQIHAQGLTEVQLEDEIKDILSPGILKDPSVTVLLIQSEKRIFSIYGQGVGQSGRFTIPRYKFRLTDAIALAGDVGQFNVSYIYVTRDLPDTHAAAHSAPGSTGGASAVDIDKIQLKSVEPSSTDTNASEDEMLELIKPCALASDDDHLLIASAELASDTEADNATRVEWVFENGKWVPKVIRSQEQIVPDTAGGTTVQLQPRASVSYSYQDAAPVAKKTRVIRIPIDKLKSGDPRYDIIVRPNDRISVPVDIIGEFWVMGNVNNQGLINVTGRPMTLKMAIAAAGGLGPLAWPKKVEVVRRIGRNSAGLMQEEIVMVDLDKIAKGLQPDFFIKPYDLVNVGTHGTSRWLASLRNAFRAVYGFGFVYDRNFGELDAGGNPWPF
jgi:polysaccharide export outer membrane protein